MSNPGIGGLHISGIWIFDANGEINADQTEHKQFQSEASLSIHGIEVPCKIITDYSTRNSKTIIKTLFPFALRIDIGQNGDLNLNSARNQIIFDGKWLLFEENLYKIVCK